MYNEIWKAIPGYETTYHVSNLGRVKSLWFNKERIKRIHLNIHGYYMVQLNKDSKGKSFDVHKLVAMAFLNHVPNKYTLVVDHINEIKTDNRVENLRLITNRENSRRNRTNYVSQYKGVCFDKWNNKWISRILIDGKRYHLGGYKTELEASIAYQNKLKKIENV